MLKLLQSKYFYYFTIPVLTILLSTFVKIVSRNDKFSLNMRADLAFGLDLSISAMLLLISHTLTNLATIPDKTQEAFSTYIEKIISIPLIILGLVVFLWIQSTIIRKFGWKDSTTMSWRCGIIIPNILGLTALAFVAYWINSRL